MAGSDELAISAHHSEAGGELVMAFQPIRNFARGSVYAYEALARRPGGTTAADVFRDLEGRELMRMERRLIWEAMCAAVDLELPAYVAINLGGTLIGDQPGLEYLAEMAARARLQPSRVIFEFPEHLPIHLPAWVAAHRILRAAGFLTAVDDLGAGYATLSVLAAYVPELVKLDLRLVQGLADAAQRARRKIVAHVATMAQDLGAEVVAEGVESSADADALLELGVYLQQGFFHGRPSFTPLRGSAASQSGLETSVH